MARTAVILFNLGGPDNLDAVSRSCAIYSAIRPLLPRPHPSAGSSLG